jgi:dipeptidyl aminopeptidase/acylaminoacyl peptidase
MWKKRARPLKALVLVAIAGCQTRTNSPFPANPARIPVSSLPTLGPARVVAAGVEMHEVELPSPRGSSKIRVYLPQRRSGKIPCVFVAPAGTPLIYGNALGPFGSGDEQEQIPYAQAGFAVVAYSIDGNVQDNNDDSQVLAGIKAFRRANGGIDNTRDAIDYALARVPDIDPKRLYTAGHSSAAVLAIQAAQHDPRIAACAAFVPATHFQQRLGDALPKLEMVEPGITDFLASISPIANAEKLRCPLFLFHADDDSNVPAEDNQRFAEAVRRVNPNVTFVRVDTGEHYQSMIDVGIPRAIQWFKDLK